MDHTETKQVVVVGEVLTDCSRGIYTQHIWYSDGSFETKEVPKGPLIRVPILDMTWTRS